ncbi:MAG: acylphosphatase [Dehalococcoidales bacterium]|nr:acylphosphatase [Dehalococcoidales bacterium]
MGDLAALQAIAQGRVQGVYYRVFASRNATKLSLTGYVRNLPDRSVEICAEGERKQLEKLVEQLKKGPPGARIDNLALTWSEYTGKYHDFSVTR